MGLLQRFLSHAGPVLEGKRVVLRLPRRGDYEEWRALRDESRAFLTPWEPAWSADELSPAAWRERLARYLQDARHGSALAFMITDRASGALCGGITLGQIRRGVSQTGVLGYWMGERYAGSGRMSQSLRLVCAHGFGPERLHRIEAACLPRNERSIALLRKAGFAREGHLRKYLRIAGNWEDHHLYALLAEDWSASDGSGNQAPSAHMPPADWS
jgi:[ribosomal protein S5]-alanine N-acetyltransferase